MGSGVRSWSGKSTGQDDVVGSRSVWADRELLSVRGTSQVVYGRWKGSVDPRRSSVRFRQVELLVGPGVFYPQPETSSVVQAAVEHLAWLIAEGTPHPRLADLCTGCGTIAIAVASETQAAEVHAVELDPAAVDWAKRNVRHNKVSVKMHVGDIATALAGYDSGFNVVVSNPPYVARHEIDGVAAAARDRDPLMALVAGNDGLDVIRTVERSAARLLKSGGMVIVEHSDRQGTSAPAVFAASGSWNLIVDHRDADGLDRYVTARRF